MRKSTRSTTIRSSRRFICRTPTSTELSQLISSVMRVPGMAVIPMIQANKTGNTLIVRGTRPVVEIIERLVAQNDKPRAEIVFDIEILEVDRNRVKNYGLNLSEYAVGMVFSPETSPSVIVTPGTGHRARRAPRVRRGRQTLPPRATRADPRRRARSSRRPSST